MFRKMRRTGQQQSDEAAIEVLKNAKRGVLSVIGAVGGVIAGILMFGEAATLLRLASVTLIVIEIAGLKLSTVQ